MSTRPAFLCVVVLAAALWGCRTSPEVKEANFIKRGQAQMEKKDYPRAIIEFRNAAGVAPKDAEPHYRLGMAYLESRDGANAVREFQRAATLNPKHAEAQLKLAEIMAASRDPKYLQEAVARLQSAYGDSPENPEAIDALAIAEWRLGKPED